MDSSSATSDSRSFANADRRHSVKTTAVASAAAAIATAVALVTSEDLAGSETI